MVFRMCPADGALLLALVEVIWGSGIEGLVIIQRGDSFGDGVVNLLEPAYKWRGGVVAGKVRYNRDATDLADYLKQANANCEASLDNRGASRVGVLLISYDEASLILKQASQYPTLYGVTWFGTDGTANSQTILSDAPLEANHVKLLSLRAQVPSTSKYTELKNRYAEVSDANFTIYQAYLYDSAWIIAKGILETGSYDAEKVTSILPKICDDFYGASGLCRLNAYGDRAPSPYDVWYYAPGICNPSESRIAGIFNPDTKEMTWGTTSPYS